jgi:hypothetical protein
VEVSFGAHTHTVSLKLTSTQDAIVTTASFKQFQRGWLLVYLLAMSACANAVHSR